MSQAYRQDQSILLFLNPTETVQILKAIYNIFGEIYLKKILYYIQLANI